MGMNLNHMVTSSLQRQLNQIVIQLNQKKRRRSWTTIVGWCGIVSHSKKKTIYNVINTQDKRTPCKVHDAIYNIHGT